MITNDKILDNLVKLIDSNDEKNIKLVSTILNQNKMGIDDLYYQKLNIYKIGSYFRDGPNISRIISIRFDKMFNIAIGYRNIYSNKNIYNDTGEKVYKFTNTFPSKITKQNISEFIRDWNIDNFPQNIYEMLPDK